MPFDPQPTALDDYRQRLRSRLDALRSASSTDALSAAAAQPVAMTPQAPTLSMPPAAPTMSQAAAPTSAPTTLTQAAQGKPTDAQAPTLQFGKSVGKAKTVGEIVNAAKPSSLNNYMDWWETQNGAIDHKYDYLRQQLGAPPNPDRKMTRKEKFAALMDFGINLIKASQGRQYDTAGAFATAVGATVEGLQGKRQQESADFAQKEQAIEAARAAEKKPLGTYGEALKSQADINMRGAQQTAEETRLLAEKNKEPGTLYTDQGIQRWNPETQNYEPVLGADGKPLTNLKVGARGGSAASRDSRTANQKNIDDLVGRGVPEELATNIVYRRTVDPRKAWADIYRDRRRQYASEEEARSEADAIIARFYGDDWKERSQKPAIQENDPLGIR